MWTLAFLVCNMEIASAPSSPWKWKKMNNLVKTKRIFWRTIRQYHVTEMWNQWWVWPTYFLISAFLSECQNQTKIKKGKNKSSTKNFDDLFLFNLWKSTLIDNLPMSFSSLLKKYDVRVRVGAHGRVQEGCCVEEHAELQVGTN